MLIWGFRAAISKPAAAAAMERVFPAIGLDPTDDSKRSTLTTTLFPVGGKGALLLGTGSGAARIGGALCVALGCGGDLVEADYEDRAVSATLFHLRPDGSIESEEDLDGTASEICEDWSEGGKYISEGQEPLLAVLLGLDDLPGGGVSRQWIRTKAWAAPAAVKAPATTDTAPPPLRWFRHPDGRRWAVRVSGSTVELRIDSDGEILTRSRVHADGRSAAESAASLVREQMADGFVEGG